MLRVDRGSARDAQVSQRCSHMPEVLPTKVRGGLTSPCLESDCNPTIRPDSPTAKAQLLAVSARAADVRRGRRERPSGRSDVARAAQPQYRLGGEEDRA